MNRPTFSPKSFIKDIVKGIQSYQTPHNGKMEYAGYAFYFLSYAYSTNKKCPLEPGEYNKKIGTQRFEKLQAFLEDNELGEIVMTGDHPSPIYGGKHILRGAVFAPNNPNLVKYARKEGWIPEKWEKMNKPSGVVIWG